ncbi:response regulator [Motilimonas pumila]|uniref:Response regulator n=1 Tax=Motilimonas pumila TaxID=2303987 RepID=A0A418YEZ5_9GAMM|nr:response regulator [Motilimonas pumila]RJG47705.1 response regulator [Motilimonas pumila]
MSLPILICDDSSLARKQMARSLPDHWDVDITFATHGGEGIEAIRAGKGDVVFLDLNMPVMDGYEVLEAICKEDLPAMVIVVSGDVQPKAHEKVMGFGALDFIKKPVSKEKIADILVKYGIVQEKDLLPPLTSQTSPDEPVAATPQPTEKPEANDAPVQEAAKAVPEISTAKPDLAGFKESPYTGPKIVLENNIRDAYQEVANVAMGQAGDLLGQLLEAFISLPIPNVNLLEVSELTMALASAEEEDTISAVCQGYIGAGIAGEALILFHDSSFQDMADLMGFKGTLNRHSEIEVMMDISNILIGAFLKGFAEQLDMSFSQGHPVVLGQHCQISELMSENANRWQQTLAIEVNYLIESHNIHCDLLMLFTEDSITTLNNKLTYLLN